MSRLPQPSSPYRNAPRTNVTPVSRNCVDSPITSSSGTPRVRTKSIPKTPTQTSARKPLHSDDFSPQKPSISIREAIALKRAEAKKAQSKPSGGGLDNLVSLEDTLPMATTKKDDDDLLELGRFSVRESIERGRSTGDYHSTFTLSCRINQSRLH